MLFQSGSFFLGSLLMRVMMARVSSRHFAPLGLVFVGIGSCGTFGLLIWDPTFLRVMVPVGVYAIGIAFIMPTMSTAALVPFPEQAGAAAAMLGFLQMGAGLVAGTIGAAMGDPLLAMALLIPLMGLSSVFFYRMYLREERHLAIQPLHRAKAASATQPQT